LKKVSYKQADNFWMPHPGHPLRARGRVKLSLESGPEGMRLKKRKLAWKIPTTHKPGPASVMMTLRDASGQEVFHSFNIQVENEGAIPEKKK